MKLLEKTGIRNADLVEFCLPLNPDRTDAESELKTDIYLERNRKHFIVYVFNFVHSDASEVPVGTFRLFTGNSEKKTVDDIIGCIEFCGRIRAVSETPPEKAAELLARLLRLCLVRRQAK